MPKSSTKGSKSTIKSLIELVLTVAVAVGLALLIQAFVVKPYRIPSGSMLPTLHIGQRILANRLIGHPLRRRKHRTEKQPLQPSKRNPGTSRI